MRNIYIMAFVALSLVIMSNRGGRGVGSTGAPGEQGATCASCHGGGDFGGSIDIRLMDSDSNEVTIYQPGEEYTVTVQAVGEGAAGFGFQAIAIGENEMQAGAFSDLGDLVRIVNSFDRTYLSHSNRNPTGVFTAKWTAPEDISGDITFYSTGIAANGNNNTAGDQALISNKVFSQAMTSSTSDKELALLSVYPNPATDYLTVNKEGNFDFSIYDLTGRIIRSGQVSVTNPIDLRNCNNGAYYISLSQQGANQVTKQFIKI